MIVDTHTHFYDPSRPQGVPWPSSNDDVLYRTTLPEHYREPGRDHWGAVQSVFMAGGGVPGGCVVGSSDKEGGYPASDPQRPENMAATIYSALGIPETAAWKDELQRPSHIYNGKPISFT